MNKVFLLLSIFFLVGCSSRISSQTESSVLKVDSTLTSIYKKYVANRYDYAGKYGEARDTIIIRFQNTLKQKLKNPRLDSVTFDSLANYMQIITSKDDRLKVFSWDEYNGGSRHIYNSFYRYKDNDIRNMGSLSLKDEEGNFIADTRISHYKVYTIEDNKYLIKGYGTYGSGKEFYVFRLLTFKNNSMQDCSGCFNGEDRFFYEIGRGKDELIPKYNPTTKEISYYELTENYVDRDKDEPSGFMDSTGRILRLTYQNGMFIATD